MHELAITEDILAIVTRHADGARVTRIVLEIGKLTAVLPDAVRFCFEACAPGTVAEGARLEIIETPGRARCRQCGAEMTLVEPFGLSVEQIDEIVLNGFRSSFLPADRKAALVSEAQQRLAELKRAHL